MTVLLETRELRTQLATRAGLVTAVDGVSLQLRSGQALALVGESGSGKSMTCASLLGLLPANGRVVGGQVLFHGQDLLRLPPRELRAIRGRRIAMVLQDAMGALNPLMTVGDQLAGVLRWHQGIRDRAELHRRSVAALEAVRIPAAAQRLASFPFQFSGGMRQRVCLAIALACEPEVLLCDEPTTALDVTVQLQILRLLRDLQRSRGMSVVFVTHDLTLAAQFCDDVAIMYAGRVVEQGPTAEVFRQPLHPYTQGLLAAAPRLAAEPQRLATIPGTPPSALDWPAGCRFAPRCAWADAQCHAAYPEAVAWSTEAGKRRAVCWRVPQRQAGEPDWQAAA